VRRAWPVRRGIEPRALVAEGRLGTDERVRDAQHAALLEPQPLDLGALAPVEDGGDPIT